jgi:hypothetical protein
MRRVMLSRHGRPPRCEDLREAGGDEQRLAFEAGAR